MEKKLQHILCNKQALKLLFLLSKKLKNLYSKLRLFLIQTPRKPKIIIKGLQRTLNSNSKTLKSRKKSSYLGKKKSKIPLINGVSSSSTKPIRIATFNAALFAVAPVIPNIHPQTLISDNHNHNQNGYNFPKSILKINNNNHTTPKSKIRVSINVPENEISLSEGRRKWSNVPVRSPLCFPASDISVVDDENLGMGKTIWEVLREVDADILALQDVKAGGEEGEERENQPLKELAEALGMEFVFAESWAPEYGNAVLSKWPIKRYKVQKILNHQDIRNVLKVTVDVPWAGEVNIYCTQLDYLNEDWRMKQMKAIMESSEEGPHILAGGLNSLDSSDYSFPRWTGIVKYFEDIGKPKPKDEVMKFLKERGYSDAKDYAGDCEPLVIIAKGQNVQGTCKYGTRVDYILSSPNSPYKFIPGSYSVVSSKGTSDHHVVKVDIIKDDNRSFQEKLIASLLHIKAKG